MGNTVATFYPLVDMVYSSSTDSNSSTNYMYQTHLVLYWRGGKLANIQLRIITFYTEIK